MKTQVALLIIILLALSPVFALTGEVISVNGRVEMHDGQGIWRNVSVGDTVTAGTVISTGFRSDATIRLGASVISIRPLTRMTLNELIEKSDIVQTDLFLEVGNIKAEVNPLNNKRNGFTVRSPVATASVRGTVFEMGDSIDVEEGEVTCTSYVGQSRTGGPGEELGLFDDSVTDPLWMALDDDNSIDWSDLPSADERSPIDSIDYDDDYFDSELITSEQTTVLYLELD